MYFPDFQAPEIQTTETQLLTIQTPESTNITIDK